MTNTFLVRAFEISNLDEDSFVQAGGTSVRCSTISDDGCVQVHVEGSFDAIRMMAEQFRSHHAAA